MKTTKRSPQGVAAHVAGALGVPVETLGDSQPDAPAYTDAWDTLIQVPLAQLRESVHNPRKRFDPVKLEELAASIRQSGVLTPLCVRPMRRNGDDLPLFEIGAGARRFRAATLAGLTVVPAVLRDLDDQAFLELLMFENPNHGDLHPLEEADGYRTLMEKAGYDVPRIAERMGRSPRFIYDSLTLLKLTAKARDLFLDGAFERGHAIELARLTPADQADAIGSEQSGNGRIGGLFVRDLGDLFSTKREDELGRDGIDEEDPEKPVSVREFKKWIAEHVRATPATIDPFLFPETAQQLAAAAAAKRKVIHITYDYRVPDAARDEKVRTYGSEAWHRADGQFKSRPCDHAVLGLVVAGPCRGEAFPVCIAKEKCAVHWGEWQKARVKRQAEVARETKVGARAKNGAQPAKALKPEPTREQRETLAQAVVKDLFQVWRPGIMEFVTAFQKLPDLLVWNIAAVLLAQGERWTGWATKVGTRPGYGAWHDDEDLRENLPQLLPGKWRKDEPTDAVAAASFAGLKAWLARDNGKVTDAVEKEILKRFDAQMVADKAAEVKKSPAVKPAPKKAAKSKGKTR